MFCPACFSSKCNHPKEGWSWLAYAVLAPLVVVATVSAAIINDNKPSISLRLDRTVCSSPCSIRVTVQVDPEANLQAETKICLFVDDGVPVTVSCWPYSGRRESDIKLSGIPAGDYSVDLRREQNNVLLASAFLRVIGIGQ